VRPKNKKYSYSGECFSYRIKYSARLRPFTIEDETDGGEDIRMKYRYLDIRRNPVKNSLLFVIK
jgi:aspartyl-tRNA synthetase